MLEGGIVNSLAESRVDLGTHIIVPQPALACITELFSVQIAHTSAQSLAGTLLDQPRTQS
jgi:hypothetical protein